jgi:hypothetical protein
VGKVDLESLIVSGRVVITRSILEPGPTLVRAVADEVVANQDVRSLSPEELRKAVRGADAVLSVHTETVVDPEAWSL